MKNYLFSSLLSSIPLLLLSKEPTKPNIIYILADDLGYGDLSCYGQQKFTTPTIDKMSQEGIRFTSHYAGSTVSAPSRCALMTGKHTGHCQVRGNHGLIEGPIHLTNQDTTIAQMLKYAGYTTGGTGKWGLGEEDTEGAPTLRGFDEWFGFLDQRDAHSHYAPRLIKGNNAFLVKENADGNRGKYVQDLFTDFSLDFINRNKNNPFFLYVAYTLPHAELLIPDSLRNEFEGKYPETAFPGAHYAAQAYPKAAYAAMVKKLDSDIGLLLQQLKNLGIDSNTIVLFSSDNGPHLEGGAAPDFFNSNGPFSGYKRDLTDGGIRVPFIARYPGVIPANKTTDLISAFWDIKPTIADIATIKCSSTDGISIFSEIIGDTTHQMHHEYLYWEFHEKGSRLAMLKDNYKAIWNISNNIFELYYQPTDIEEKTNLSEQMPEKVSEFKTLMNQARTQHELWTIEIK